MSRTVLGQGADWLSKLPAFGTLTYASGAVAIATGKPAATVFFVQIFRDGVETGGATVTLSGGTLTVASTASGYTLIAGDVINWIVF